MVTTHQIRYVKKSHGGKIHERITHIGGVNPDGTTWELPQREAIIGIECGRWIFYICSSGDNARVIVGASPDANKYLKTEADYRNDNLLLLLPEYPWGVQLG